MFESVEDVDGQTHTKVPVPVSLTEVKRDGGGSTGEGDHPGILHAVDISSFSFSFSSFFTL